MVAGSALQVFSHTNHLIFQWFKNDAHQVLQSHPEDETRYRRHKKLSELQLFCTFPLVTHCSLLSLPSLHRCCCFAFESALNPNLSQGLGQGLDFVYFCPSQSATQPVSAVLEVSKCILSDPQSEHRHQFKGILNILNADFKAKSASSIVLITRMLPGTT